MLLTDQYGGCLSSCGGTGRAGADGGVGRIGHWLRIYLHWHWKWHWPPGSPLQKETTMSVSCSSV